MFLKKIEMKGFKSFADKVVINFDQKVTGIVGPNGCGKSNISDAIRWVLGEQSAKSLRGTNMSDVIFAGSEKRKTVNLAEVTLVFDNTNNYLNSEFQEIEITRRLHRSTGEGEYFINRTPVRLKDITDLILDSGIGKDSLSMISQGNISTFAESKPQDRRAIFEEAAGVSKYKKRKIESLNKLNRTQENLERTNDILAELERQVNPLRRAAKKALTYREKKERLKQIEIAVLVDEIDFFTNTLDETNKAIFDLETKITMKQTSSNLLDLSNSENKQEQYELDRDINNLQGRVLKVVDEIQILEKRRTEIEEKRKYTLSTGDDKEKANELKALLEEAKFEYDDREKRYNDLKASIELNTSKHQNLTLEIIEQEQSLQEVSNLVNKLENRIEVLNNILRQPFNHNAGVSSVMNAKDSLPGVLNVVAKSLEPEDGYEEAISVAIGGALYHIITKDEASARNAINFLKRNQSGRATFLPITVLYPRTVAREHQIVCENTPGYLGTAFDFIRCEKEYDIVFESLLGNVLVCDNLENGNNLSSLLKQRYRIVTLDGDVINRDGSMTGGKQRNSNSPLTSKKELQDIEQDLTKQKYLEEKYQGVVSGLRMQRKEVESELLSDRISFAKIEQILDAKRSKYEKLLSDYEVLNPDEEVSEFSDDLIIKLTQAYHDRDDLTSSIKSKRERHLELIKEIERKDQQNRQVRNELSSVEKELNNLRMDKVRAETKLESNVNVLNGEYQLTYEYAKENLDLNIAQTSKDEVRQLRQEIESLGNINMSAPEDFEEVNERYEFIKKQYDELNQSREELLKAIEEMDTVMTKQFKEMFDKINGELNTVFSQLFGGGKANLFLEDPEDILNTGIDITVQPPGKSVQNIRLFSGGEKALIAISVLFAILRARPVPLCIFDEVEAALDQANVERFAKYLKKFSDDTQFIVVTHRPGTMENCDVLYGVTMPIEGVSQMMKVKLVQAQEYSAEGDVI